MARCITDLSTRSDSQTLAALAVSGIVYKTLLNPSALSETWRIIELFSSSGAPFNVLLSWSAGQGAGATAWITVARSTRVAVYARAITVQVGNLSVAENSVTATIADGYAETHNQWELRGALTNLTPSGVGIPPFSRAFRVELADATLLSSLEIRVYDGTGTLCSHTMGDAQPDGGIPLGGAASLEIESPTDVEFRVVFYLRL